MKKRMVLALLLAVLVFGGVIGTKLYFNKLTAEYFDNMPAPVVVVSATPAAHDSWVSKVSSVGTVVAIHGAELTTEVSGIVDKIYYRNGSQVKKGDTLISLDSSADQAELKSLQAAERLATIERDRVYRLWQNKSVSKSEYDTRQSQLEQAQSQVAAHQARMQQKQLRALYDGHLGIRRVNVGQYVNAGDPMISLQSLDAMFVDFTLPEERYSHIVTGQRVIATMDALGETSFEGEITAIEPVVDTDTRNFNVQATFANDGHLMRPGMFARVSLEIGEPRSVVMVPRTSISYKPYGNSVFVLTDSGEKNAGGDTIYNVKQRFVTTGEERGDLVSIDKGLEPGEQVATSGLLKLRSGGQATVNNTVQPSAELSPTPANG